MLCKWQLPTAIEVTADCRPPAAVEMTVDGQPQTKTAVEMTVTADRKLP
ncbi:MAG: hypothetical protein QME63_02715 [Actinomycetota bacterium]|nr:hypothetical protein [Actinomycetota bacterium]